MKNSRVSAVIYGVVSAAMLALGVFSFTRVDYLLGALAIVVSLSAAVLVALTISSSRRP